MKSLPVRLALAALLIALPGCASLRGDRGTDADLSALSGTVSGRLAQLTARELERRAATDPDSLDFVSPELHALALALAAPAPAPAPDAAGLPAYGAVLLPPPDDVLAARSLWHGIHLASYRIIANAVSGWDELQHRHGDVLAGRDARLETVTLPGQGEYLRLKAGPYDTVAAAREACRLIEQAGDYCLPVDFTGRAMADIDHDLHRE